MSEKKVKYKCIACNEMSTFTRSSDESMNGMIGLIAYRCDNCKEIYSDEAFKVFVKDAERHVAQNYKFTENTSDGSIDF